MLSGGEPGQHQIQGIGAGFVPQILDPRRHRRSRAISEADARTRRSSSSPRSEGLLVGISAGAAVRVALDVGARARPRQDVVTILCDTGERYFSLDEYFR